MESGSGRRLAGARKLWKNGINLLNWMVDAMIDRDGYRPNVAIVLVNARNQVFWGKRIKEHAWQFPQGGIKQGETPEQAMFRELEEETGLRTEAPTLPLSLVWFALTLAHTSA